VFVLNVDTKYTVRREQTVWDISCVIDNEAIAFTNCKRKSSG